MTPHRGEIWLVDFGEPVGREQAAIRPAVVLSTDALNEGPAGVILVVPVTSTRRNLPSLIDRLGIIGPEPLFDIGRVLATYSSCDLRPRLAAA